MERINATTGSYNFIDLFAGAGGLSEGFIQAGFSPVAHVEMNPYAAQTLETRTGYYYLKAQGKLDIYKDYISGKITRDEFLQHIPEEQLQSVFCETMSNETLPRLFENIDRILTQRGIKQVDVIIGGPPCQAYSLVGRAQSKHMETPMSADPRNDLYKLYARFLQKYQPKMFVFENVMGIKSANGGATWLKVQEALRSVGYEIECHEQNSKNFGVLQNRRRMIIVGWLKNSGLSYPQFEQTIADATVNDILSDLPALQPGGKSGEYRSNDFSNYLRSTGIRKDSDILTHHCARPNKDRDIEIYRRTIELWNDGHKRLNYNDLPDELKTHKNRKSFLDRFKVVEGDEAYCHTMLAHISKDGHYFIHPDIEQHRSITVREAARIQSFPDDYFFEGPRTAQFVQIGNAVPKVEITSRMPSYDIPKKLSQLETPYTDSNCLDTAIATNMIAVGMDVDRLGLMVVTGQPKQNSEYIQATSRIGRSYPGLVVTLYNPYRPRDLSHYENFTGYHAQLYRFVEGTTATPFSARARDRVLHALVISAIRLHYPEFASNDGAAAIDKLTDEQLNEVKALIMNRLNIIKPSAKADAEHEIDDFISNWKLLATQSKGLRYYVYTTKTYNRLMNTYGEVCTDLEKPTLRSMRDVESAANMFYYTED